MDAPLLLALARARLRAGEGSVQGAWARPRALALLWAPDRRAGLEPGLAWVFLLNPAPELWLLHERDEAYLLLKAEAKADLSRRWPVELKGARLTEVEGDPRERWLGLVLRRRGHHRADRGRPPGLPGHPRPGRPAPGRPGSQPRPHGPGPASSPPARPSPASEPPPYLRFLERFGAEA